MSEKFVKRAWLIEKLVLPQDTDHAGVMWHGSYLKWLEEARIDALSSVGVSYSNLSREGFEMPVVELRIKYLAPLLHGDQVLLKSWVLQGKGPRLHWQTKFFKDSSELLAISNIDLVLIKKDKSRIHLLRKAPSHIQKALIDLKRGPLI